MAFFAANWQTKLLSEAPDLLIDICYIRNKPTSEATHLFIDIGYIMDKELPGLMNIVALYDELKSYVPVYRVALNRQDAEAIGFAVKKIIQDVTSCHPKFEMAKKI